MNRNNPTARIALVLLATLVVLQKKQACCHELQQQSSRGQGLRRLHQVNIIPKIVGGEATEEGRFPYMCNLKDQNHKHVCGGVLIAPQAVLTAAHCVDSSVEGAVNLNLLVSVGAHKISDNDSVDGVQDTKVVDIKIQEDFQIKHIQKGNDIAILILTDPAQVQPVPLPIKGFPRSPDQLLLALGWGQSSSILQQIYLESVGREKCLESYPSLGANIHCAQSEAGDTCKGDSGGPLIIADAPDRSISRGNPRFDTLVALTSFGVEPCEGGGAPGGYTLVGPFRDWIDSVLGSISKIEEPAPPQPVAPIQTVDEDVDKEGKSALFRASSAGQISVVKSLISTGSDVNRQSNEGESPLHAAATAGHADVVEALVAAGADVDAVDENGSTPLINASKDAPDVVRALLAAGAAVDARNEDQNTALIRACTFGDVSIVEALIEAGANVDSHEKNGYTPLINAAFNNYLEIVRVLIAAGADVNIPTDKGYTPIINAAHGANAAMVQALLDAGADPDVVSDDGNTAINNAASNNYLDVIEVLISAGADVNLRSDDGFTPIIVAAYDGSTEVVRALLAAGADPDAMTDGGVTAVLNAADQNHLETIEALISAGAYLEPDTISKWPPLVSAAYDGHNDIIKALLDAGADINAGIGRTTTEKDNRTYPKGSTALHVAVLRQETATVKLLLGYGADKSITNSAGDKAKDLVASGASEISDLLG